MTPDDLGEQRRLIFENAINGVPVEDLMVAFSRSELEVNREIAFVAKKIKEYRFRRAMPPLACETDTDRRWNRRPLLDTLSKLGNVYLSTSLLIPKLAVQNVENAGHAKEAARRVHVRINE